MVLAVISLVKHFAPWLVSENKVLEARSEAAFRRKAECEARLAASEAVRRHPSFWVRQVHSDDVGGFHRYFRDDEAQRRLQCQLSWKGWELHWCLIDVRRLRVLFFKSALQN